MRWLCLNHLMMNVLEFQREYQLCCVVSVCQVFQRNSNPIHFIGIFQFGQAANPNQRTSVQNPSFELDAESILFEPNFQFFLANIQSQLFSQSYTVLPSFQVWKPQLITHLPKSDEDLRGELRMINLDGLNHVLEIKHNFYYNVGFNVTDWMILNIICLSLMPPKKKKKKSKKKKKVYDPPVYQIPIYDDPDLVTPKVELTIKHGTIEIPDDAMTLKISMFINSTINKVAREIQKHHQGAVKDIQICKEKWDPLEMLPNDSTLEKCGIVGGEAKLFYDFIPITYPLLG